MDTNSLLLFRSKGEIFGVFDEILIRLKPLDIQRSAKERRNDDRSAQQSRINSKYQTRKSKRNERAAMKSTRLSYIAKPFITKTTDKLPSTPTTNTRSVCNKIDDFNQLLNTQN